MIPRGLFINPEKITCSISESGEMIYNCLKNSDKFHLDYIEIDKKHRIIKNDYDFYAFNYHISRMNWLQLKKLHKLSGIKLTFVLEVSPGNPFVMLTHDVFDCYCVLDPTLVFPDKRVYSFPRPLEVIEVPPYEESDIPVIGTFGFLTRGKGYAKVVEAVSKEFDRAIVKINVPHGKVVSSQWRRAAALDFLRKEVDLVKGPGIDVLITEDYMTKPDLIRWCSQNTLNCFLYDRDLPGLAATTDQCISSGRPLAVSTNETFRHIHQYMKPYPERSLQESITLSGEEVKKMQYDWSPEQFMYKFEQVLGDYGLYENGRKTTGEMITLPRISDARLMFYKVNHAVYWRYRHVKNILKTSFPF